MADSENEGYDLVTPFWIDTDAYSDRDRVMFCAGVEFQMVRQELESSEPFARPIHRENESRFRMLCARLGRKCEIRQHEDYEGCETWSDLEVAPK